MKQAKKIYAELCEIYGQGSMNIYTSGWKEKAIYDYIKEGSLHGFIASLDEPAPFYLD